MSAVIWISMVIFFLSYANFCIKTIGGKWTVRTKWSELSREQWLTFAGMVQFVIPLIALSIVAAYRT